MRIYEQIHEIHLTEMDKSVVGGWLFICNINMFNNPIFTFFLCTTLAVLLWVDILAMYAMYMMMAYLTNVWKLGFTRAAAIVNVFWGVTTILPLPLAFLVETITGNYWMLLLSSFSYSAVKQIL